jgi:hypothetical protein
MMLEATVCNFIPVLDSAAAERFSHSPGGKGIDAGTPIPVEVRVRSDKGMSSAVVTPASLISARCHPGVGTLLDCYL